MDNREEIARTISDLFDNLNYEDLYNYPGKIEVLRFTSGSIFIEPGDFDRHLYFIKKGLVRAYYVVDNEYYIDKTIFIRSENFYFGDYYAIILNKPTILHFECLEDSVLYKINFNEMELYMKENARILAFGFSFLMKLMGEYLSRSEDFIFLNAEKRYIKFMEQNPDLIDRVSAKYISSLLGITPVSLSRIKNRIKLR